MAREGRDSPRTASYPAKNKAAYMSIMRRRRVDLPSSPPLHFVFWYRYCRRCIVRACWSIASAAVADPASFSFGKE
jgi:hypothetical protein